jgi:hypothetical protein
MGRGCTLYLQLVLGHKIFKIQALGGVDRVPLLDCLDTPSLNVLFENTQYLNVTFHRSYSLSVLLKKIFQKRALVHEAISNVLNDDLGASLTDRGALSMELQMSALTLDANSLFAIIAVLLCVYCISVAPLTEIALNLATPHLSHKLTKSVLN